jgi:hypothetical protein
MSARITTTNPTKEQAESMPTWPPSVGLMLSVVDKRAVSSSTRKTLAVTAWTLTTMTMRLPKRKPGNLLDAAVWVCPRHTAPAAVAEEEEEKAESRRGEAVVDLSPRREAVEGGDDMKNKKKSENSMNKKLRLIIKSSSSNKHTCMATLGVLFFFFLWKFQLFSYQYPLHRLSLYFYRE